MSEEKLDLILTVVSELKGDVGRLDLRVDSLEKKFDSKIDSLEKKFDSKIDSLEKELKEFRGEFNDFKHQVIQTLKSLNGRIDTLEKQMFAIGMEIKEEVRHEIADVRKELNRLENKIILEQAEKFENESQKLKQEVVVRELTERVKNLEINLKEVNLKLAT